MISILYQNNVTGDAFDVTTLCAGAKWSTKRSGSPASLELTMIADDAVVWTHGGIVALKDDDTGIFYGYVVKIGQDETDQVCPLLWTNGKGRSSTTRSRRRRLNWLSCISN